MSEPPNTTSAIIPHDHHHHHQHHFPHQPPPPPLTSPTTTTTIATPTSVLREYRKGNWTLHETLVLITAKKMDDERRQNTTSSSSTTTTTTITKSNIPTPPPPNHSSSSSSSHHRTAELRWKWVENYCWKHGCMRSQNQCNDKWDNLLRDYKKVREYQLRVIDNTSSKTDVVVATAATTTTSTSTSSTISFPSYWVMEKHERKERNLPTNLLSEVFEALNEVVHRRYNNTPTTITPKISSEPSNKPTHSTVIVRPQLPPPPPPPPQQQPPPPPPPPAAVGSETSDSSETDWSDSNTKRRKVRSLGSSIVRSASVLARTLVECEEKKDRRHRHVMELEERKLQIEETRNEVNKQGFAGLIAAVNNLSGAIQAFVSNRHNNTT